MPLQCGIVGLTNTGKTTLFNCISNTRAEATRFAFSSNKSNIGMVNVPDMRLERLEKLHPTGRVVPASIEFVDIPGLTRGASHGEGVGNQFLADIRNTDALIHVLRCFDDETLPHIDGTVDPVRDKETVDLELQVKDLESITKKILRIEKNARSGDREARQGLEVLKSLQEHIGAFRPARSFGMAKEGRKWVDDLFLLTDKPVMYVCNVDERSAVAGNHYTEKVREAVKEENTEVLVIAAAMEAEISELDNPSDRIEFLESMGLSEPGVNKLIRGAYKLLSLQTFFTMGPKETRAWTIRRGMNARQASGVIHSDMERGFIRAEVMKYSDFVELGSENACREKGRFLVEGRDYVVKDGDILHIRFNV